LLTIEALFLIDWKEAKVSFPCCQK